MDVAIHYHRLSQRGLTVYVEDFVADDGVRLVTYKTLPDAIRASLSAVFWEQGLTQPPRQVGAVRKHYFYNEPFTVLEFYDPEGALIGYYSDIATPLTRINDEYHITDLFLDWWMPPGAPAQELDWPEFDEAIQTGALSPAQAAYARAAMARVREEIRAGVFPHQYLL